MEESAPPAFGSDGFPTDWAATRYRLVPDLRPTVVPGHGALVDVDFARAQRDDIRATVAHVRGDTESTSPFPSAATDQVRTRLLELDPPAA